MFLKHKSLNMCIPLLEKWVGRLLNRDRGAKPDKKVNWSLTPVSYPPVNTLVLTSTSHKTIKVFSYC